MADIASLLANAAQTNADFDLGKINRSYWQGLEQAYAQKQRELFKDGVPTDASGNIDYPTIQRSLLQNGQTDAAFKFGNLALNQTGQDALLRAESGSPAPVQRQAPPTANPPSVNRQNETPVAPAIKPSTVPNGPYLGADAGTSIVGMVSAAGVPDELAGPIIQQVSAVARTDPNAPVDPKMAPRLQQIVQAAVSRSRGGAPATATTVPQQPDAEIQDKIRRYTILAANPNPQVAKAAQLRLEALQKQAEPTTDMKNAAASGLSLPDYQNRADENTVNREVLTKAVLPRLDKSQEGASAARDEIQAIHRAREQLDAPGGIFNGSAADIRTRLAKVGAYFNIPDERIQNTETFGAAIGSRVLALVKNLGAGTSISNADRDFAAAMAGGSIKLDEKSIRRILEIGEQAARERIRQHRSLVTRAVRSNDALKSYESVYQMDEPGSYQKLEAIPAVGTVVAGYRFMGGDPKDQRSWRAP